MNRCDKILGYIKSPEEKLNSDAVPEHVKKQTRKKD
jgi:hypothetical protein